MSKRALERGAGGRSEAAEGASSLEQPRPYCGHMYRRRPCLEDGRKQKPEVPKEEAPRNPSRGSPKMFATQSSDMGASRQILWRLPSGFASVFPAPRSPIFEHPLCFPVVHTRGFLSRQNLPMLRTKSQLHSLTRWEPTDASLVATTHLLGSQGNVVWPTPDRRSQAPRRFVTLGFGGKMGRNMGNIDNAQRWKTLCASSVCDASICAL